MQALKFVFGVVVLISPALAVDFFPLQPGNMWVAVGIGAGIGTITGGGYQTVYQRSGRPPIGPRVPRSAAARPERATDAFGISASTRDRGRPCSRGV